MTDGLAQLAPAKINLTLHVTGRRADGYHLLDSLVCFATVGDWVSVRPAADVSLALTGPEAGALVAEADNLVLRAARAFGVPRGAAVDLVKNLPVSSGIGGGSADAAATLRLLARLWDLPLPRPGAVLALGADVPVCLRGESCRMSGIGEVISAVPALPPVWAVLANPRLGVTTPAVFKALAHRDNPGMGAVPGFADAAELAAWLAVQRNDLEAPARAIEPVIGVVLEDLARLPGALLARMSGSGATCFALFGTAHGAEAAAAALGALRPGWWVRACGLGEAAGAAAPAPPPQAGLDPA